MTPAPPSCWPSNKKSLMPCNQNLARLRAFAVHLADRLRLARNIKSVGGVHLHAVRKLVGLNASLKLRILSALLLMLLVQGHQQIELPAEAIAIGK